MPWLDYQTILRHLDLKAFVLEIKHQEHISTKSDLQSNNVAQLQVSPFFLTQLWALISCTIINFLFSFKSVL